MAGDTASRSMRILLQKIYPLQVIAALSPLLGLLGTVVGMILAFEKVSGAGSLGNAAILADDISLALMTTMAGLCIAVPMLVCYHIFRSRIVRHSVLLESEVNRLMAKWFLAPDRKKA
ncbi:MAG: MotA/TolQ/ExbB proton channel family protein [Oscillospiraceae bacterium]|nr:MotA/TolQ/ExbB proton channel family protein [Oscillospiraceae bacterium]